jgi:adenosylcobinamide-GDP ribazoletransferase
MKTFFIALQFLTILPLNIASGIKDEDFGKSLIYFPVIGLFIGAVLSLIALLFSFLPNPVNAVLILIASFAISGGIHLDGLADTCDGFYGAKPKEKILEIMRDSRVGVMGVTAIVCLVLLKYSLIVSIPQAKIWKALIMMATFSRWSQVLACCTCQYARLEGKGKFFIGHGRKKELVIASILTVALFLLLARVSGVIVGAFSLLPVALFIRYADKRIGGMTGDTIGATSEIAEVAVLFFTLIYL